MGADERVQWIEGVHCIEMVQCIGGGGWLVTFDRRKCRACCGGADPEHRSSVVFPQSWPLGH